MKTTVNKNDYTTKLETTPTQFVAIWSNRRGAKYITAMGDDFLTVKQEGHFHWAVMCDYEGSYKVLPTTEVEW